MGRTAAARPGARRPRRACGTGTSRRSASARTGRSPPLARRVGCWKRLASADSPQSTKQQLIRGLITHELGHNVGVNTHTTDATDIMYQYTSNWIRDGHFSPTAAGLLQIHNKGLQ